MSDSNTRSCKEYVWKVGPYVDGELPGDERDGLEDHLSLCEDCQELASTFRNLDSLAAASAPPEVSGSEWARVLDNVTREEQVVELETVRRRSWEWILPASAAAALLVLGLFFGRGLLDRENPGVDQASGKGGAVAGGQAEEPRGVDIREPEDRKTDEDREDGRIGGPGARGDE